MTTSLVVAKGRRAESRVELKPLVDLCRAGRLFDVQAWIAAGKPVNPPKTIKGARIKSPLDVALELGFHSLIDVLLRGGSIQEPAYGYASPVSHALHNRRLDIIELLVEHGCDPKSVAMIDVLRSWDPRIFRFFIDRGVDLVADQPFAQAFCERIRTALHPFKEVVAMRPELIEQANIAIRHHCKQGDAKWISLLLWAGADPWKPGADAPGQELSEMYDGLSALGYAALYQHYDMFRVNQVRTRQPDIRAADYLSYLNRGEGTEILASLLGKGLNPNDQDDGGCSVLRRFLDGISWSARSSTRFLPWESAITRKFDSQEARDTMKAIHLLAKTAPFGSPRTRPRFLQRVAPC